MGMEESPRVNHPQHYFMYLVETSEKYVQMCCVSPWRAIWHSAHRDTNSKELSLFGMP